MKVNTSSATPLNTDSERRNKPSILKPMIMFIFCSAIAIGAVISCYSDAIKFLSWPEASGTVIHVESSGSKYSTPTVSYIVDGNKYTVVSQRSTDTYKRTGQPAQVAYNKTNPTDAIVKDSLIFAPLVYAVICGIFATIMLLVIISSLKPQSSADNPPPSTLATRNLQDAEPNQPPKLLS